jgi:hypothetical protein
MLSATNSNIIRFSFVTSQYTRYLQQNAILFDINLQNGLHDKQYEVNVLCIFGQPGSIPETGKAE